MMEKLNKSNLSGFNEKMIFSSAKEDKKLFLWDENTGTITYTYDDQNSKNFISKILILGRDLYSEYLLTLQENKSLITFYKTNASEPFLKCNPVDERITCIDVSDDSKHLYISTENGNFFIYEVFSGNVLITATISSEKILEFKSFYKNNSGFLFVCEDYIKFFLLENLLDKINFNSIYENMDNEGTIFDAAPNTGLYSNGNSNPLYEFPNTDKFSNAIIYGIPTSHCFLYSKNKISVTYFFKFLIIIS